MVIAYSVPAMFVMWHTESILLMVGQKSEIAHSAGIYMRYLQWALPPALATMGLRNFVAVMEKAQVVLWATVAGALVNAALDYVLIFGAFGAPRLELVGAGIASMGTNAATFAVLPPLYDAASQAAPVRHPRSVLAQRLAGLLPDPQARLADRADDPGRGRPVLRLGDDDGLDRNGRTRRPRYREPMRLDHLHGVHGVARLHGVRGHRLPEH
ncbi:MAG: MATE family efflux transporter [Breoghania sp.]|nr:MATE family efflux transporter [Breoghania sp.]MDJ0932435.1 MATE family efflux transporter [Breoghania sp.]